jgi:hypothetical protein
MAVTGNKKEQTSSNYSKTYGICAYDVLGVNLSNKALKELGFYVKEEDLEKEREFLSEREGVSVVQLEFACKAVTEDNKLRRFSFWLENSNARNSVEKERSLYKFINDQGKCAWSTTPNEYTALNEEYAVYFTGADDSLNPRPAKKGEEEFMLFMRACMAINFKDGGTIKYNVKKLFNGNFKELQEDLKTDYLTSVIVATTIKIKESEEGIKEIESFYPYAFAPGGGFKVLAAKKQFSDADVEAIHTKIKNNKGKKGKERKYVTPLEELIAKLTDAEYPCKEVFNIGLPVEYDSTQHIETSQKAVISSDVEEEEQEDTSRY